MSIPLNCVDLRLCVIANSTNAISRIVVKDFFVIFGLLILIIILIKIDKLCFFSSWKAEIQGNGDKTKSAVGLQGQK